MKTLSSLFALFLLLTLGYNLDAQSLKGTVDAQSYTNPDISSSPVELIIVENAPHLPWVQRTESTDKVYKGERFSYELEPFQAKARKWASEYPAELKAYRAKMPSFFLDFSSESFKGQEQDFYYDMKAQYELIAQNQGWNN